MERDNRGMITPPTDDDCPGPKLLPVLGQGEPSRSDAQRNRRLLMEAAYRLIETRGVAALVMDEVAAAAGVGVGTVYRRFGDRGGLAFALLDETEKEFQAAFMWGPPPLGPGAPPAERIRAFCQAYVDRLETQADLHVMAEAQGAKAGIHEKGAYMARRAHLVGLLKEAKLDNADYLADALMALQAAALYVHQRRMIGLSVQEIKEGLDSLVTGLVYRPAPDPGFNGLSRS